MTQSRVAVSLLMVASLVACGGDEDNSSGAGGTGAAGGTGSTASTGAGLEEKPLYFLRIEDGPPPPLVLELDKQKALEVFGEETAKQITLLNVDSTPLLVHALTRIQNACGTSWQNPDPDPMYDCSLTPLGQSFGPNWQMSPQFAMVRLLGMTPANADVTGTSLEEFKALIDGNPNLFQPTFADILAKSLFAVDATDPATDAMRTSTFIPMPMLVLALQQQLLATHSAIPTPDGTIPVTMYDALLDLTPLAEKLGPSGSHPGVLVPDDPTFTTRSDALLPGFRMRVTAESNLRWVSGIDLSQGAGDMFLAEGDSALEFDFIDPQKLAITGIAPNPTVDMRIQIHEHAGLVPSCTDPPDPACKANYPPPMGNPVGMGTVWTLPPWLLEPIVAKGALNAYNGRTFSECYLVFNNVCQVGIDIGQGGDPPGWTVFTSTISFGGDPVEAPPPQFLWELLNSVAQVALHDPNGDGTPDIPEGQAQPVYPLYGLPIGLTGDELIAQMRPTLQSQAAEISDAILGRYWVNNNALDFYYRRAEPAGDAYLFFVAESDLRADPEHPEMLKPYTYDNPGFFTSPDLSETSRVSAKDIAGIDDTEHEKYRLPPGETTLYMQDDENVVYEVQFYVPENADPREIVAQVSRL